jgi:hypothetical protein
MKGSERGSSKKRNKGMEKKKESHDPFFGGWFQKSRARAHLSDPLHPHLK